MKMKFRKIGSLFLVAALAVTMIPASASKAYTPGDYSYFDEYTMGWNGRVAVYKDGKAQSVQNAGLTIYNVYGKNDDPFVNELNQDWDADTITLTQPARFTESNGTVHDIENMLTGFDFIADPTAIDNSDVDGKLYVYGTTEGFSYGEMGRDKPTVTANPGDILEGNRYQNHSLTILSTSDMVNWTDEGFMDSLNLTNLPSTEEANFVKSGITSGPSWAPSGLKYRLPGTDKYKYYLFYTNGGSTGYVMSDTPYGPWEDPEGGTIFSGSTPNCSDCSVCFDPGVLLDDKNEGYVYFGGLSRTSGRACKIQFDPDTGKVSRDGDPVKLPTYAMFEDNEINMFNGKYYYSYCTDFSSQTLTKNASIAVYVSSDPLDITFDPGNNKATAFQPFEKDGVYHHFLGTVLDNPSNIFGEGYNNHHHMQEFKGHTYILYHSTVLHNTLHRINNQYRNLHVDEIEVHEDTDEITALEGNSKIATYEGPEQIESFNPYFNMDGSVRFVNATTSSYSAGVKSTRDDLMVVGSKSGSPMVLDSIETGDWIKIQGVDFTDDGMVKLGAEVKSETNEGAIEVFLDDPTSSDNLIATIPVKTTGDAYEMLSADIAAPVTGEHDIFFVFRGKDYTVSAWKFDNAETIAKSEAEKPQPSPSAPATTNPSVTPAPQPSAPAVSAQAVKAKIKITGKKTVKVGKSIKLKAKLTNVKGKVKWSVNKKKLATISKAGKLKAKKKGTVKVTAKVGKVKATVSIKIK